MLNYWAHRIKFERRKRKCWPPLFLFIRVASYPSVSRILIAIHFISICLRMTFFFLLGHHTRIEQHIIYCIRTATITICASYVFLYAYNIHFRKAIGAWYTYTLVKCILHVFEMFGFCLTSSNHPTNKQKKKTNGKNPHRILATSNHSHCECLIWKCMYFVYPTFHHSHSTL